MLVKELIKKLQRFNPNREVRVHGYDFVYGWEVECSIAESVESVKLVNVFNWSGRDATEGKKSKWPEEKVVGVVLISSNSDGL